MDDLQRFVKRAYWRLNLFRFLRAVPWWTSATLLIAAGVILADKYYPMGVIPAAWVGGAFALGLVLAAVWTYFSRNSSLDAAIEVDRRFGLRERVSSALSLHPADADSPVGRAVIEDALRRVQRVELGTEFRFQPSRWSLLPLLPALLAFLVATFVQPVTTSNEAQATTQSAEEIAKQAKENTRELRKRILERKKRAEEEGLEDAKPWLTKLEEGLKEIEQTKNLDREKALVKLNDLAKELEERRKQLGGAEQVKQQLKNLDNVNKNPAEEFTKALKDGDLKQAVKELEKLQDQIAKGDMDEEAKEKLQEQLQAMKEKLQKMADAQEKANQQMQQQLDKQQQQQAGGQGDNGVDMDQLQQQLDQLAENQGANQMLKDLAQKLGQAAQGQNQNGQNQQQALDDLGQQLDQLQQQLDEMQMLDDAMAQLNDCKNGMCQGQGQGQNGKQGNKPGFGRGKGDPDAPPGNGLGEGRGEGFRPEERTDTKEYDSRVRQKPEAAAAVVTGLTNGPNIKGNVRQEIQSGIAEGLDADSDPLTDQRLPRKYRDHAKDYFNGIRQGD